LRKKTKLVHNGAVSCVAYSGNGSYLAAGDSNRKVRVYDLARDYANMTGDSWTAHTAKVRCLAWSPDSIRLASGSVDCNVMIWNTENVHDYTRVLNAHKPASVNGICWLNENTVVSAGQDSNIKFWEIS